MTWIAMRYDYIPYVCMASTFDQPYMPRFEKLKFCDVMLA
jgi:hypothetical protein